MLSDLFVPQENSSLRYLNLMFNNIGTSGAELIAKALHVSICLADLNNGISFDVFAFDELAVLPTSELAEGALCLRSIQWFAVSQGLLVFSRQTSEIRFHTREGCTVLPLTLNYHNSHSWIFPSEKCSAMRYTVPSVSSFKRKRIALCLPVR